MAIVVQANIAVAWPSTVVSIPAGWERVTELDSVYIVGASAGADTDLLTVVGNTTHIHTSPPHTPVQDAHTHDIVSSTPSTNNARTTGGAPTAVVGGLGHTHTATASSVTATNTSSTITVDTTTNDLSHTKVIWIKSVGTAAAFPANSIVFWDTDSLPAGWTRTTGGFYLKGAAAAGNGGATAGANTHTHTSPPHTHGQNSHNHTTPVTSSAPDVTTTKNTTLTVNVSTDVHTHSVAITAQTAVNNAVTTTLDATNHEPPYKYVNAITAISADYPIGAIAVWLGTNALIPTGWTRATSLDTYWPKCASADAQVLTTGGTTTHTHTASNCQPTQQGHSHVYTNSGITGTRLVKTGLTTVPSSVHTHTWTDANEAATNQSTTVTINDCTSGAAYPLYRTVIFVKLVTPQEGAATETLVTSYKYTLANGEDLFEEDLTRATYRTRRRGEG